MRLLTPALRRFVVLLCLLVLAGSAVAGRKSDALTRLQYDFSGAVRWGDFEGAWNLVDPKIRAERPVSDLDFERYRQVQISSYRDRGASVDLKGGQAARDIEIGVINRYTQAERTVRYREVWRWDAEAKTWWVTSGLPDLWAGQ
ncbi:hypothetical protein [Lysobacter niastensis]|uniref:DUF4440 domain-containing protein n=1 Tax=Lysobacter niastensis TaxID=380629 RepID=A0ABS0B3Q2_9GAMM|nr:hypothetical protein [Lysobacter niastensis]MBF6023106.1 hypothetical protein [Lysobacter niastensis]